MVLYLLRENTRSSLGNRMHCGHYKWIYQLFNSVHVFDQGVFVQIA